MLQADFMIHTHDFKYTRVTELPLVKTDTIASIEHVITVDH